MKKISISILSLAIFMMTACDSSSTRRQGSDNTGTTANSEQGMGSGQESDAMSGSESSDPVERAEKANEQKMENSGSGMMGSSTMEDKADFIVEVADASMLELELSKLAVKKASNADVRSFAQRMVNDHTKMNQELKSIAQRNNVTVPQAMSSDKREAYERISKLQGEEFDKEYLKEMESRHDNNIDKFESMANNEEVQELREFANKNLSVLKEHHHMAEQLAERVDNNKSKNSGMGSGTNSDSQSGGSESDRDTVTLKDHDSNQNNSNSRVNP